MSDILEMYFRCRQRVSGKCHTSFQAIVAVVVTQDRIVSVLPDNVSKCRVERFDLIIKAMFLAQRLY